jgi:hypothetical protein
LDKDKMDRFDEIVINVTKILDTDEKKMNMIMTMLGVAGHLAIFINENKSKINLSNYERYCMALVGMNMITITQAKEPPGYLDYSDIDLHETDKFIHILKQFYELYKDELGLK